MNRTRSFQHHALADQQRNQNEGAAKKPRYSRSEEQGQESDALLMLADEPASNSLKASSGAGAHPA